MTSPAAPRPSDQFPRLSARTRRFTLGRPRDVAVAANGSRVVYLRSLHGEDPVNRLWTLELSMFGERLLVDPHALLSAAGEEEKLSSEERARRERRRESGGGIVAFAGDRDLESVTFALSGRLFLVDVDSGEVRELPAAGLAFDPRLDPTGRQVAYVSGGALYVVARDGRDGRLLVGENDVSWGLAEFVAAEEMGRTRGFWWGPDGSRLAAARVEESKVLRWHIANPVDPALTPQTVAYPAAGTTNADVTLWLVETGQGGAGPQPIVWDREAFPYLARVRWGSKGPLTLLVQTRDQREARVLVADQDTGRTEVVQVQRELTWVELVDGSPDWLPDGRLVTTLDRDGTRRLAFDGVPVTPPGLQVRRVLHAGAEGVLVAASHEPTEVHVIRVPSEGGDVEWLTAEAGVHGAVAGGDVAIVSSSTLQGTDTRFVVRRGGRAVGTLPSDTAPPPVTPDVHFHELGPRRLRAALLMPSVVEGPLPVLLDPYAGPHAQRVVRALGAYLTSQWFAEQGFAVLLVDGRGTPGRGPNWERAIHLDLAGPVLEDQVEGLVAAAELEPRLDLGRVAIRGWSFGGYLAALAVLRRPDLFHAAVAGAPVTEWTLYDTHYTERYLGHPDLEPDAYRRSSLVADAHGLERPLLLVHGLGDDNVVSAHSLVLSRALLEAARPHSFLPLSGVTHMTPQEVVAESLMFLELAFLQDALGLPRTQPRS
ncbi:MAG: prolyl oligopeptidase family serine peptidase [Actinomycetota bacterium]|nr:prolyl oligopeptidase family serine peptidase [Actinomycetota bacterium]